MSEREARSRRGERLLLYCDAKSLCFYEE